MLQNFETKLHFKNIISLEFKLSKLKYMSMTNTMPLGFDK